MAKKPKELTPAEQELSVRRVKLDTANKANTEKSSDKTVAAVEAAKAAVAEQTKVVNRERFARVGGGRANKALIAIGNLGNVAAPRSYEYSSADVDKLEAALKAKSEAVVAKLRNALTKGGTVAKSADGFTF